jgi:hypothetical protein
MFKSLSLSLVLTLAAAAAPALAADATPSQVYEAARSGHLAEAQQMINQVLRDHPQSGEAHYVAAEVNARMGNLALARQQLAEARRLEPGLPFASQSSVEQLERQLGGSSMLRSNPMTDNFGTGTATQQQTRSFPWGWLLLLFAGLALLWRLLRRRAQQTVYRNYPGGYPAGGYQQNVGPGGAPGVMPPGGVMPGTGSGMMGGLATGLAAGAGLAAGQELIHRVTGDHSQEGGVIPNADAKEGDNANMGGKDFGLNDDSSWDDGGGGGTDPGGGGDDWT